METLKFLHFKLFILI